MTYWRAALLVALAVSAAAGANEAARGELVLSPDYTVETQALLPRPVAVPWRIETRTYDAFHATEWQLTLAVDGQSPAVRIEDGRCADFVVSFPGTGPVTLHWSRGSHSETQDFAPQETVLAPGAPVELASMGGRSSDGVMPYFNLQSGEGGLLFAIGWTGDWRASFVAGEEGRIHITAGLGDISFTLPPGETLRLPSTLVMPYAGSVIAGQNAFRRLMLAHFTPANHPPMELTPVAASVHGLIGFNDTTEENLVSLAGVLGETGLAVGTFWLDAGWNEGGFPLGQGNPQCDPARFPQGLAPVGTAARAAGLRFLAWFEPERVIRDTWLDREHPDWLLFPSGTPPDLRYQENDGFRLLDLGNPEARAWALDSVSAVIKDAGIAIYRQDFNLYPAYFWHTGETPKEKGLREIRYINGLYAYLDGLQERFPALIIDNCASGGRRLDVEMMRRSVALWRSDSCWGGPEFPRNVQAMAHGLSRWLPLHGLGAAATDDVALRSGMGACASFAINFRAPDDVEALRAHLKRYLPVRPLFGADYYPLTPWSSDPAAWIAYQFNDAEAKRGIVQAFCGNTVGRETVTLALQGLNPDQNYLLTDWDQAEPAVRRGESLMTGGLTLRATRPNEALVVEYAPLSQALP